MSENVNHKKVVRLWSKQRLFTAEHAEIAETNLAIYMAGLDAAAGGLTAVAGHDRLSKVLPYLSFGIGV